VTGTGPAGRIHVDGAPRLRAALKRAAGSVQDLKDAHRKVAEIVADRATETAPIGPPPVHVRDTIRAAGTARAAIVRAGKARVPYAMSLHWGHQTPAGVNGRHVVKAQPWISQAAQDLAPRWTAVYLAALDKIIDTVERTTTP